MKHIGLIGAGHAHLEVVRRARRLRGCRLSLISETAQTPYSGVLPRVIAGTARASVALIDAKAFAERQGVRFIEARMRAFDVEARSVTLADGRSLAFDVLSLDLGGGMRSVPILASERAVSLRPASAFLERWRSIAAAIDSGEAQRLVVIGGGPAAVEIACALRSRIDRAGTRDATVRLLARPARLCPAYSAAVSERIRREIESRGVQVRLGAAVREVGKKQILIERHGSEGVEGAFDWAIVAAGASKPELAVDARLRPGPGAFAAGDAIDAGVPRSGVSAVRQGQYLAHAIEAEAEGAPFPPFSTRSRQLNILTLDEGTALAVWDGRAFVGRWPMRLKTWIDQRYLASFAKA